MFKAHEEELDRHLKYIRQNLKTTRNDPINRAFGYVTRDDLLKCYGNEKTVLTIRNHKEVHKPGLLTDDDESNVILNRALIVTSEGQLDVRLVSTTGDSYKKIEKPRSVTPEVKNNGEVLPKQESSQGTTTPQRQSKRKQDFSIGLRMKRKKNKSESKPKEDKDSSESETETDIELKQSACIILGEIVDPSKEKFALREFECQSSQHPRIAQLIYFLFSLFFYFFLHFIYTVNPAMIRLNPPANTEYQTFSLYDDEGIIDLFDIPGQTDAKGKRYDEGELSNSGTSSLDFV